ncbi:hypothetical protein B484DRAFT_409954, partial [Ochromonadaceae sp. CCMP2298]
SGRDPDQVAEYRTDEIQQLREQVHRTDVLLRGREDEIEELHERLAKYNSEIQELYGRVARRDIQVQELRAATRDDLIRWAKGQQGGEESRYLQELIQRRNQQLEQLHQQVAERDDEITQLHERAARRNEEITLQALQYDQTKAPFQRTSWQDADLQRVHLQLAEVRLALAAAETATVSGRNVIAAQEAKIQQLQEDKASLQSALDAESGSDESEAEGAEDSPLGVAALREALADVAAEQKDLQQALAAAVGSNSAGTHTAKSLHDCADTAGLQTLCDCTTGGTAGLRELQ